VLEGVSESDTSKKSDSVSIFTNIGLGLVVLFGTLWGLFFFRKEELKFK